MIKSGQDWAGIFATYDSDGSLKAPSSGPTGTLYIDGTSNAATVTITGSNPYKFSVTLPTLTAGQRVDMYITATISSIATAGIVASDQADTSLISDVKADTADLDAAIEAIKGSGWTDETLVALMEAIEAISTGATPQQIWEYVSRTLTDASDLGLATSEELAEAVADIQGGQGDTLETMTYKINTIDNVVDTIYAEMGSAPEIADAVLDELLDDHTIDGSLGDTVADIAAKTNNLPDNPAATGDAMTLTAAYEHAKDDVLTPLGVVDGVVDAIKLKTDNIPATPANEATLTAIKGTGWSDETLVALMNAIEAISVGSGATPQQIWEYVARTLTNPDDYKADVSGLATTTHLQEVENKVDAVGTSVATPATVWAYPDRTLTVSSIRPRPLVDGDQFTIYKDATINIPVTKLGDISVYDNLWFTIKREQDLESADDQSVVHMDLLTGMLYLNKQAAVAAQGSITIVDATTGSINILITKEGAALLPVYAREPLRWEVKGIHGEIVDILLQGSCFIQPAVSRKIS